LVLGVPALSNPQSLEEFGNAVGLYASIFLKRDFAFAGSGIILFKKDFRCHPSRGDALI
jgi:hypothetical protein